MRDEAQAELADMRMKLSDMHQKLLQREKDFNEREARLRDSSSGEVGELRRQLSEVRSQLEEAQQVSRSHLCGECWAQRARARAVGFLGEGRRPRLCAQRVCRPSTP